MLKKRICLSDDMLKLISNIHFSDLPSPMKENDKRENIVYSIDYSSLYGGSYVFEDISMILGLYDKRIKGTEEDVLGPSFPKNLSDYMYKLHSDIVSNLDKIEELVHYFSNKGGLTPGEYAFDTDEYKWKKII